MRKPSRLAEISMLIGLSSAEACARSRGLKQSLLEDFASLNEWKEARAFFSLEMLADNRPAKRTRDDWSYAWPAEGFDHLLYFKRGREPIAIATQPYEHHLLDYRDLANALLWPYEEAVSRLKIHYPSNKFASFHYPGRTSFAVITRVGTSVNFLPEQETNDG